MADITSVDLARLSGDKLEQAGPDLLRAMVKTFAEALTGAEADAICGAPYGQVSEERVNYRNGYRDRRWDTRAGTIELAIPRLRPPRVCRLPGVPGEGRGLAQVPAPACEIGWHRRGDAGPPSAGRPARPAATGAARPGRGRVRAGECGVRPADPVGQRAQGMDQGPGPCSAAAPRT